MLLAMNKLLTFLVCFVLLSGCKNKSTETKEPAGRVWMKDLYSYSRVKNIEVPTEYKAFEKGVLESPDRMKRLYDYLKADSADVPNTPTEFVEKITDGFSVTDVPLTCVWMNLREGQSITSDYPSFKKEMANDKFRTHIYNELKSTRPGFTVTYLEFTSDMGFNNKHKGVY
jgi:hypothetical protein